MVRKRTAVLISGRGSNMRALVEATKNPGYPADIAVVVSNVPDAGGLAFAQDAGIPTAVVDHTAFATREAFEDKLQEVLRPHQVDLICCAGFMRILSAHFLEQWHGRVLNIHPSLLPLYKGLHTHARALADGQKQAGCSVHFVTPALDGGPVVAQAAVPVLSGDTEATLAARVLAKEHGLYVRALAMVASGQVTFS